MTSSLPASLVLSRRLPPTKIGVAAALLGGSLAIAAGSRLHDALSPAGAAASLAACAAVVWGATRASSPRWATALCAIGALPAGFVTAVAFPEAAADVAGFRGHYLLGVGFVASQAAVAVHACRERESGDARSLVGAALFFGAIAALSASLGAPALALVSLALGAASVAVPLLGDARRARFVERARAGLEPGWSLAPFASTFPHGNGDGVPRGGEGLWVAPGVEASGVERSLVLLKSEGEAGERVGGYRDGRPSGTPSALLTGEPSAELRGRLAQLMTAGLSGSLAAAFALGAVVAGWALINGFALVLSPFR